MIVPIFDPVTQARKTLKVLEMKCHSSNLLSSPESLRGCTDGSNTGATNKPGVPNLTGTITSTTPYVSYFVTVAGSDGVFDWTTASRINLVANTSGGRSQSLDELSFDASNSSSLYGASSTVMPASVNQPLIIYLGTAAQV